MHDYNHDDLGMWNSLTWILAGQVLRMGGWGLRRKAVLVLTVLEIIFSSTSRYSRSGGLHSVLFSTKLYKTVCRLGLGLRIIIIIIIIKQKIGS